MELAGQTAEAASWHPQKKAIYVDGKLVNHPFGIVKNNTTYVAIKYVMQALKQVGITSTWDGTTWRLTAPSYLPIDLTHVPSSHGNKVIRLNGHLIYRVDNIVFPDPATHERTTFMPIVYMERLLTRLGIGSTWDGYAWRMTTPPPITTDVANSSQYPTLQRGNDGYPVVLLQQKLNAAGYNAGSIDGQFGPRTLDAVRRFQAAHKLTVDGIVGPRTWSALNQALAQKFSIPITDTKPLTPVDPKTPTHPSAPPSSGSTTGGYKVIQAWANTTASLTDAERQSTINRIANDNYSFSADGSIQTNLSLSVEAQLQSASRANGTAVFATVANFDANGDFSGSLAHQVLTSSAASSRLLQGLVNLAEQEGDTGIDIDFENIPAADGPYFTAFLRKLEQALHAHGKQLSVTVPARTGDAAEPWNQAYDYCAIGQVADWVPIMTYDFSWTGTGPGPIAPLYWDEQVLQYATGKIPTHKILLGIGAYGYDWDTSKKGSVKALSLPKVDAMITQYKVHPAWDSTDAVPWFSYRDAAGDTHQVYYENQASIQQKLALADKYGVAGIAFWKAGLEDQGFWNAVNPWAK